MNWPGVVSKPASEVEEERIGRHDIVECQSLLLSVVTKSAVTAHDVSCCRQPGRSAQSAAAARPRQPRSELPLRRRRPVFARQGPARRRRR